MRFEGISCFDETPLAVTTAGRRIESVETIPFKPGLPWICKGFTDLQVNGYMGLDYSDPAFRPDMAKRIAELLAARGTLRHLATIITSPRTTILNTCAALAKAADEDRLVHDSLLGIHVEGPFISSEDGPRGAHDPHFVRPPDYSEFLEWQDASGGRIRMVTVAPETTGALHFIERLSAEGVIAAIGHTGASPDIIHAAVDAGARTSTHLGNGSHASIPRLKNYIWEQLAEDRLCASIITDGFHLPDAVIKSFLRAKGPDRCILVSDVAFLAGTPPGLAKWGDMSVEVHPDGHISLAGTQFLAGAGHLLSHDLAHLVARIGLSVPQAVRMCTENPARLLGIQAGSGAMVPGERADLVAFSIAPESGVMVVLSACIGGEELYHDGI